MSHQAPDRYVQSRSYIAVDEKVDYGKPISQAELDRILKAKRLDPEIITYGLEGYKEPTRDRRTI